MIDYSRLIREYLDCQFIEDLISNGVVDRRLLYDAVLRHITSLNLLVSTNCTGSFYDLDECFTGILESRMEIQQY